MRRLLPGSLILLGLGLGIAGAVVFALANRPGAAGDAGWTAYTGSYAPLEQGDLDAYHSSLMLSFDGWAVLWTGGHLAGAGLIALGLLLLVGTGGWLLGVRAGRRGART